MAAQQAPTRGKPKKQIHKAVSKKRKFVKDGVFYAELNDFLSNELSEQGYAGCEVRVTPQRTEIIIRATNSAEVIGDNGRRIRELTALIQKRFKFPKSGLICFAEKVRNKGFSALTQAQAVKYRLLTGLTVRRAAYSCLKYIMDSEKKNGALGCEIIVSGKLRGQRAKGMKFRDGFMIHAGDPSNYYIDTAVKHVHLPQGVIGIKVKIMKPYDATGRDGIPFELPDKVTIPDPKEDNLDTLDVRDASRYVTGQSINRPPQAPTGGAGGAGGGAGGPGGLGPAMMQPPQAPQPPQQAPSQQQAPQGMMGPQGGYGAPQDTQYQGGAEMGGAPVTNVMEQGVVPPQTQYEQQQAPAQQQFGTQPVQQDFAQQGQYNAPQQFDQYQGQQGAQFQQFNNQYQEPMQQQFQQPVQQQYQGQGAQGGQFGGNQGAQYYDANRNNYGNF